VTASPLVHLTIVRRSWLIANSSAWAIFSNGSWQRPDACIAGFQQENPRPFHQGLCPCRVQTSGKYSEQPPFSSLTILLPAPYTAFTQALASALAPGKTPLSPA